MAIGKGIVGNVLVEIGQSGFLVPLRFFSTLSIYHSSCLVPSLWDRVVLLSLVFVVHRLSEYWTPKDLFFVGTSHFLFLYFLYFFYIFLAFSIIVSVLCRVS